MLFNYRDNIDWGVARFLVLYIGLLGPGLEEAEHAHAIDGLGIYNAPRQNCSFAFSAWL